MKEFLSIREIEYQSIDVAADAAGLEQLRRLGARSVPVVSRGDEWVSALTTANVVEFLGLDESAEPELSPAVLVERLLHVLDAACRYTRQFDQHELQMKLDGRDRSYGEIAHHVFNIPVAFLDAVENQQQFTYESTVTPPPPDMHGSEAIASFGETVRQRLSHWWQNHEAHADPTQDSLTEVVETYYGRQSVHELLERTTWHSTQHVRQLISLLQRLGREPIDPLTQADLQGLPLPKKVWD